MVARPGCEGSGEESGKRAGQERAHLYWSVCAHDGADVCVQFVQPRDAGPVSDVFDQGTFAGASGGDVCRRGGERGGAGGRDIVWQLVGADWAAAGDRRRGAAGDSGHSAVGVFPQRADAGAGRLPDAVYGAGCVGRNSGASERIVAAGGARNVPGVRLPAGEFSFFEEFGAAGEAGGTALWRQFSASVGVDGAAGGEPGSSGYLERQGTARG